MATNSSWLSDADFVKNVKQRENVEKEKKMWQKNANTHNFAIVLEESMTIRGYWVDCFRKKFGAEKKIVTAIISIPDNCTKNMLWTIVY